MDDQTNPQKTAIRNLRKSEQRYNFSLVGFIITGLIALIFLVLGLLQIRNDFINQVNSLKDDIRQQQQNNAENAERQRQAMQDYFSCVLLIQPEDRSQSVLMGCNPPKPNFQTSSSSSLAPPQKTGATKAPSKTNTTAELNNPKKPKQTQGQGNQDNTDISGGQGVISLVTDQLTGATLKL